MNTSESNFFFNFLTRRANFVVSIPPIMRSCFMIGIIFVLPLSVSALDSELTSPSNGDSIFGDMDQTGLLSSSNPTSLFDQTNTVPEDSNFGTFLDPSDPLFQETSSSLSENDQFSLNSLSDDSSLFDDSFEIADDCSTSNDLLSPIAKKSRVRRRDGSGGICKNSNEATDTPLTSSSSSSSGGGASEIPDFVKALFTDPYAILHLTAGMDDERRNRYCQWFTSGLLPYGVCSSGVADDQSMSLFELLQLPGFGKFGLWRLDHCTLGMSIHIHHLLRPSVDLVKPLP